MEIVCVALSAVSLYLMAHSSVPVSAIVPAAHCAFVLVMKVWMSDVVGCLPSWLTVGRCGSAVNVDWRVPLGSKSNPTCSLRS